MNKISKAIVRYRNWILLVAVLLLIPSIFGAMATRVNYDILSYLPATSQSMQAQAILEDDYNLAGTALIVVDNAEDKELADLSAKVEAIDGVDKVLAKTSVLDETIPKDILPDELLDSLYSGDSALLVATFTNPAASDATMDAIQEMEVLANEDTHIAGFSAITSDTRALIDKEVPIYSGFAVLLCLVVLALGLKSWLAPIIFIVGMAFPIIYNAGTNWFLGQISYLTKALSMILLLAVSMDFSIFLLHRYEEEKQKYDNKDEAMASAITATALSITSSSLTTVAGFLCLIAMQLTLGKDIGIVMAKGVILAVLCVLLVLPSLLMFFDPWIEKWTHPVLIRPLNKSSGWIVKHRIAFIIVAALLFGPALYAQSHTSQYYDLAASLPDSLASVSGTAQLKDKFNMNTSHFILVDEDISEAQMNEMISQFEDTDGITSVVAWEKYAGSLIPADLEPAAVSDILNQGGRKLILVNSEYRVATDETTQQLKELTDILHTYDPGGLIAGEGAMTEDLIDVTSVDFKTVNTLSIIAVFIIVALTFKSITLPVILVACIELAIAINLGIPYLTGTTLPFIAGIVVGTIQLGACIDYAILMTSRFKEELAQGASPVEAAKTAIKMTSPSIITSGLSFFAACSGVSLIAQMDLIRSLCMLLGRGALISVCVILTVLPCLLTVSAKLIAKTTIGWPQPKKG